MAGRLTLYIVIRKIHLYAACIILGFMLMYFITGFIMTHPGLVSNSTRNTDTLLYNITLPAGITDAQIPDYLYGKFKIRGKPNAPRTNENGNLMIDYNRPGYKYQVTVYSNRNQVKVVETKGSIHEIVVGLHRMNGYGGGLIYHLYIILMDLTGIALIVFSLTGLYMALKFTKSVLIPLLIVSIGLMYTLYVIYSLM